MHKYEVVVSNIGTVASDIDNPVAAKTEYGYWVKASKSPHGRASGESVTLIKDGEI